MPDLFFPANFAILQITKLDSRLSELLASGFEKVHVS